MPLAVSTHKVKDKVVRFVCRCSCQLSHECVKPNNVELPLFSMLIFVVILVATLRTFISQISCCSFQVMYGDSRVNLFLNLKR